MESSSPESENSKSKQDDISPDSPEEKTQPASERALDEVVSHRMIYEDDLRKACDKRALDIKSQRKWMAFRSRIPISQWVEHSFSNEQGKSEKKQLLEELEDYYQVFSEEAKECNFKLEMEHNYYSEAVELLSKSRKSDKLEDEDRKLLTELIIMVDYRDAKLGIQIVKSIL